METNKIYLGDSTKLLKDIDSESIDMILTSPPYDEIRTYDNLSAWNFETFKVIAKELVRIIKRGGVIIWIVNDQTINGSESGTSFRQALYFQELGLNIHDTMIWDKGRCPFPDKTRYSQCFEYMFVLSKGTPKSINLIEDRVNKYAGDKIHGTWRDKDGNIQLTTAVKNGEDKAVKDVGVRFNIWEVNPVLSNNERTGHPAQFSFELAKDHILSWSNVGDVILDPFMGSGTTAVACIYTDRQYIGLEINEKYWNISQDRIKRFKETAVCQETLF